MDCQLHKIQRQFYEEKLISYDQQNITICRQITEQLIENVVQFYSYSESQSNISWQGQIDMLENLAIRVITTQNIKIYQLRVHKQTVSNYCGFHASYNLIAVLQTLKWGWGLDLLDGVSFWSYMLKTQNFLRDFATKTDKDKNAWPWRESDIQQGDFERTYWKTCMNYNPVFYQTFKSETNPQNGMKINVIICTVYFQFGHLNNLMDEVTQLENQIKYFCQFKPSQNNSLILAAMLGITNHWVSLIAIKSIQGIKIFLLDSRVRDYLEWTEAEMQDHINQANSDRIKSGLHQLTEFQKLISLQGMKDLNQCLFLLTEWLYGTSTVDQFIANSFVKVFLDPLYNKMQILNTDHFIHLNIESIVSLPDYINILENWAESYYHTISRITQKIYRSLNATNLKAINKCQTILSEISQNNMNDKQRIQSIRLTKIKEILENLQIDDCSFF